MSTQAGAIINNITDLVQKRNWNEILNLNRTNEFDWTKLIWVWPKKENFNFIGRYVGDFGLGSVTSVGCGTGLLEWLLQQCTGIQCTGIEVDELWWKGSYSLPQFIPIQYVKFDEVIPISESTALMFCYFNDGFMFQQYIKNYIGNLVIIIGPGPERGTHTNPTPFDPDFGNEDWQLVDAQEIGLTKDFIAVYTKKSNEILKL